MNRRPNKVPAGGTPRVSRPNRLEFDPAMLATARAAAASLKRSYVEEWGPAALDDLDDALAAARLDTAGRCHYFRQIHGIADDLVAQGRMFGFPLLGQIGRALAHMTEGRRDAGEAELAVIGAQVEALRTVLDDRIEGYASEAGRWLMADLQVFVRRHLN